MAAEMPATANSRPKLTAVNRSLLEGWCNGGRKISGDGQRHAPGGILSPVLANIYLHYVLDRWFERAVKKRLTGFAQLVRYADDFIVCFQYGSEARAFAKALRKRLAKFGLTISEEKSRIIEFGRYACQRAKSQGKKCAT